MERILVAVVMGIVEGLTEFLPVSSTGHLILAGQLLGFTGEAAKSFEIFIQLGAIAAVALLYREKLWRIALRWRLERERKPSLTVWHVALGMLPAVVVGLLAYRPIKQVLFSPGTVLVGLAAGGVWLLVGERFRPAETTVDVDGISPRQAFLIGCFQCLALWPGFSRSGATIAGALLIGIGLRAAADFSFMLAVPVMVAASGLDLIKSAGALHRDDVVLFAVGFAVSFVVAWAAVVTFLRLLERIRLAPFAWYRFAAAGIFALYFFA
jgi:undecaprenyl-diphosphatase